MRKKYLILFGLIFFLINSSVCEAKVSIEDVFKDIDKNYKYYNELQHLYDKGIIIPNSDGNFDATGAVTKDELFGILVESSCNSCIKPFANYFSTSKYEGKNSYSDVDEKNKYLYCIEIAKEKEYFGITSNNCEAGNFCGNSNLTVEHAISLILNNSKLYTNESNNDILEKINAGTITDNLVEDLPAKEGENPYEYYGYFQKALNYKVTINGVSHNFFEVDETGKANPKSNLTREQLLKMMFVVVKNKPCENQNKNSIATNIRVYEGDCSSSCEEIGFTKGKTNYTLEAEIYTSCENGYDEKNIIWKFYNKENGDQIIKTGSTVKNYGFGNNFDRQVVLQVQDKCEKIGESFIEANIGENSNSLNVNIILSEIFGGKPYEANFEAIVSGGDGNYTYNWDLGNGKSNLKKATAKYESIGNKIITLTVKDGSGNIGIAKNAIEIVSNDEYCKNKDSDGDSLDDCTDLCPFVSGEEENRGCPIFNNNLCEKDNDCKKGYYCKCKLDDQNNCTKKGVCTKEKESTAGLNATQICLKSLSKNTIEGNVLCNSCPCDYKINYNADLRVCDLVFPAIISGGTSKIKIFSAGPTYQFRTK